MTLRVRWFGRVPYREALDLQHALFDSATSDHLLLLEHPHVYTLGVRASTEHILTPPASVGADLVRVDRGGDVTYHGPGQLVGYPILTLPGKRGPRPAWPTRSRTSRASSSCSSTRWPSSACTARRGLRRHPGVWLGADTGAPRKIAAIGVRLSRGRTMHGFALNVSTDLSMFEHIVPCGIADMGVTSLAAEGVDVSMQAVVDVVSGLAVERWGHDGWERQDVAWRDRPEDLSLFSRGHGAGEPVRLTGRLAQAGVTEGLRSRPESPSGCARRCTTIAACSRCGTRSATSASRLSAKRRDARTSPSAGPTAPRHS